MAPPWPATSSAAAPGASGAIPTARPAVRCPASFAAPAGLPVATAETGPSLVAPAEDWTRVVVQFSALGRLDEAFLRIFLEKETLSENNMSL